MSKLCRFTYQGTRCTREIDHDLVPLSIDEDADTCRGVDAEGNERDWITGQPPAVRKRRLAAKAKAEVAAARVADRERKQAERVAARAQAAENARIERNRRALDAEVRASMSWFEQADLWLAANPQVFEVFVAVCFDLIDEGSTRIGHQLVTNNMRYVPRYRQRWDADAIADGSGYKLNTNYGRRMMQLACEQHPELLGYVRFKHTADGAARQQWLVAVKEMKRDDAYTRHSRHKIEVSEELRNLLIARIQNADLHIDWIAPCVAIEIEKGFPPIEAIRNVAKERPGYFVDIK
jgi:hypothetical protein